MDQKPHGACLWEKTNQKLHKREDPSSLYPYRAWSTLEPLDLHHECVLWVVSGLQQEKKCSWQLHLRCILVLAMSCKWAATDRELSGSLYVFYYYLPPKVRIYVTLENWCVIFVASTNILFTPSRKLKFVWLIWCKKKRGGFVRSYFRIQSFFAMKSLGQH